MNRDVDPTLAPPSAADLAREAKIARQAKLWAWYVRSHFCLTLLWALMMLKVIPTPVGRLLDGILEFSMYEVFVGPILSIVLISRAARFGGEFIRLAIVESFLSASGFWIILPAAQ
jgi:hypothetical protein